MSQKFCSRRVALITGAAGAIGKAIASVLTADGFNVVLTDIASDGLENAAKALKPRDDQEVFTVQADMGDPLSIAAMVNNVIGKFGRIDAVINNAAINYRGSIRDFKADEWDHMMAVNLRGPALLCQYVAPYWEKQKTGRVVNIASRAWVAGGPPAYVASKAGLVGLTRSLARELAGHNVTANAIAPGLIPSAFTMDDRSDELFNNLVERSVSSTPLGRLTSANDVASAVSYLVSSGASFVTGEVIHVCGGSQLAPIGGADYS